MRILLDTNIVIDALSGREPFNAVAEQVFLCCERKGISGYLSGNSMTDIYYLLRKHLPEEAVRQHIRQLMVLFTVLPVGEVECTIALNSPITDFEDAIQVACAERFGIDYIITRDSTFIQQCAIAITPAAFIKKEAVNSK